MNRFVQTLCVLWVLAMGCGDDGSTDAAVDRGMDAEIDATLETDQGSDAIVDARIDAPSDALTDSDLSSPSDADDSVSGIAAIEMITDMIDGAANLPLNTDLAVSGLFVTGVRPTVGDDLEGFYVQAAQQGPAILVLAPSAGVSVGDELGFDVRRVDSFNRYRRITEITNRRVVSSGTDVSAWVQDLSAATDVVSNLVDYESEYVSAEFRIASTFRFGGEGFVYAMVDTDGISGNADLRIRIAEAVQESEGLRQGCTVNFIGHIRRFNNAAQFHGWSAGALPSVDCP